MLYRFYYTTEGGIWQVFQEVKLIMCNSKSSLTLPQMRTIEEAYAEIKSIDINTAITKNFVRTLVVSGKVTSIKAGRKYLVNMDTLKSYLYEGEAKNEALGIGKIRPISDTPNRKWGIR